MRLARFLFIMLALLCVFQKFAQAQSSPVVNVSAEPAQQMSYGMDFERLWDWDNLSPEEKKRLAKIAISDCRVHYIRIAINALAEQVEGKFEPAYYDQILDMMAHMKEARPDIKLFASPRPIGEVDWSRRNLVPYTCFPFWITIFEPEADEELSKTRRWKSYTGFDSNKAADYMVRYVRFMKSKGFTIDYLDLKNEIDRLIKPPEGKAMALRIREQLGADSPKLVGPSSFSYSGLAFWMKACLDGLGGDFLDIASVHNTGSDSVPLKDAVELANKLGKQVWNTEMHSWRGPDNVAATNTSHLFEQIRSGVNAVNDWLSLGNKKKEYKMFRAVGEGKLEVMRVYYIYKQLVNTSTGGNYIPTDIPAELSSTVAFIQGKKMTVWLINAGEVPVKGITVNLGGRKIADSQIQTTFWGPDNPREGSTGSQVIRQKKDSFVCEVPAKTLICYEFNIE